MPGDLGAAGADDQLVGAQQHPHPLPDQPRRHRVVTLPHRDSGMPVHAGGQHQTGLEPFDRERPQQPRFPGEVLPDGADPVADPTGVVGLVVRLEASVELSQARHLRDRHQVGAPEPAALALDAALLVGTADPGLAVERVETMV